MMKNLGIERQQMVGGLKMEDKNFACLMSILRILEKEDLAGSNIETCINHLTEIFNDELSEEQKTAINGEFARYYKRRSVPDTPEYMLGPSGDAGGGG